MSETISGTIDSIYTKTVPTKFGDKAVYHAIIGNEDINLGFKHNYSQGEQVNLPVEHKYGGYQLIQGGAAVSNSNGVDSGANSARAKPAPIQARVEFPVPEGTKGITIARQNSGGHAARIVAALIDQGVVTSEAGAAEAFFELAYQITDFATGNREVKQAKALQGYGDDE